jgi:hypothetical protein
MQYLHLDKYVPGRCLAPVEHSITNLGIPRSDPYLSQKTSLHPYV